MRKKLPVFKGYFVDVRLKQFRRIKGLKSNKKIEFIDFNSEKGEEILSKYVKFLHNKKRNLDD